MRDVYVALVYAAILGLGFMSPFVFTLGYAWVDIFYPQLVAPLLGNIPVALVMALMCVLGAMGFDRRDAARFTATRLMIVLYALWMTLSLIWAEVPDPALTKYSWAVKTVLFAAFIPQMIRSRVQIEAFVLVYVASAAANIIPFGVKTLISGGGYGQNLGLLQGNSGLAEGSTLSAVSIAMIPLTLFVMRHSLILPQARLAKLGLWGFLVLAVVAPIGTVARTALFGYGVVAIAIWLKSQRKFVTTLAMAAVVAIGFAATSDSWTKRIDTVATYNADTSAMTRLLVWKWTLDYVASNPLGGSFDVYRINYIYHPPADVTEEGFVEHGRAFHSLYFEILGELGIPGAMLFGTIVLMTIRSLRRVMRQTRGIEGLVWANDLAFVLMTSLLSTLACSAFIGIAFQSALWYLIALPICLQEHVRRALAEGSEVRAPQPAYARPELMTARERPI